MTIYLHNSLEDYLHKVETSIIKLGWFGFMSNKGCQCASFNIADRSFQFHNVHMCSGQDKYEKRNLNVTKINKKLNQPRNQPKEEKNKLPKDKFDHVFFMGDTNYRVNGNEKEITDLAISGNWQEILKNDQLKTGWSGFLKILLSIVF